MQSTGRRRKNDGGVAAEACRSGKAQEERSCFGVIGTSDETAERRNGREQKIESFKKALVPAAKIVKPFAFVLQFVRRQGGAPFEASGDDGIELMIEAGVNVGCLISLDGSVNIPGLRPERRVERLQL